MHIVTFGEEEVRKDAAQTEMCKAGLEKALVPPTTTDSTLMSKGEKGIAEGT